MFTIFQVFHKQFKYYIFNIIFDTCFFFQIEIDLLASSTFSSSSFSSSTFSPSPFKTSFDVVLQFYTRARAAALCNAMCRISSTKPSDTLSSLSLKLNTHTHTHSSLFLFQTQLTRYSLSLSNSTHTLSNTNSLSLS